MIPLTPNDSIKIHIVKAKEILKDLKKLKYYKEEDVRNEGIIRQQLNQIELRDSLLTLLKYEIKILNKIITNNKEIEKSYEKEIESIVRQHKAYATDKWIVIGILTVLLAISVII